MLSQQLASEKTGARRLARLTFIAQSQKQGDGRGGGRELQVQSGALAEQPVLWDVVEVRVEDGRGQRAVAITHHQPGKKGIEIWTTSNGERGRNKGGAAVNLKQFCCDYIDLQCIHR